MEYGSRRLIGVIVALAIGLGLVALVFVSAGSATPNEPSKVSAPQEPTPGDPNYPFPAPGAKFPVLAFDGSHVQDAQGKELLLDESQLYGPDAVNIYELQVADARRRQLNVAIPPPPNDAITTSSGQVIPVTR